MGNEPHSLIDQYAHQIIGAAIEVHKALGPGFLESTYESALAVELQIQGILFSRQHPVALNYKGHAVGEGRLDLLVADCLVVELKAVDQLMPIHQAQIISYLKATGLTLGLLINFNVPVLRNGIKRVVLTK